MNFFKNECFNYGNGIINDKQYILIPPSARLSTVYHYEREPWC